MKTSITRYIEHSVIVDDVELHGVVDLVKPGFKTTSIEAECSDGTRLETTEIEDILSFENADYRQITWLQIYGYTSGDENLRVVIDRNQVRLHINSSDDKQALYMMVELANKFASMKAGYDLLARYRWTRMLSVVAALMVFFINAGTFAKLISFPNGPLPNFLELAYFVAGMVIFVLLFLSATERLQDYLYPRIFFLLGKQKRTMEWRSTLRKFLFGGVLFTIVLGILSNYLSQQLLKQQMQADSILNSIENDLPPEFQTLLEIPAGQPEDVEVIWRCAFVLAMVDDEKARVVEVQEGDTVHLLVETVGGDRFSIVRPPLLPEVEQILLEQVREIVANHGQGPNQIAQWHLHFVGFGYAMFESCEGNRE